MRLRWPVLPLLEPIASENRGAFKGELIKALVGYGRSEALEEESDKISPSAKRLRRRAALCCRSSSSYLGSITSRDRFSQPRLALNWARAR